MDSTNYDPRVLKRLVSDHHFSNKPFIYLDVGCSGGIDPAWSLFKDQVRVHAFDPQQLEIDRLQKAEKNPNVKYYASLVGLPDDHPFKIQENEERPHIRGYHNTWPRSSAARAAQLKSPAALQSNPIQESMTTSKISVDEFVRRAELPYVDFLKIDTDGADFEILHSSEETFQRAGLLGVMIESNYTGSHHATANTWHNVDRFLKQRGFMLFNLSINRFSRSALPAPFLLPIWAQTCIGQPIQGDFIYLRDAAATDYLLEWPAPPTPTQLLKLASLYDLFRVPDCAAELLVAHRATLSPLVDVDMLLDLLSPMIDDRQVSYAEFIATFEQFPEIMFPGK